MTRAALVALVLAACQPYYRDAELRGRAARDPARTEARFARAAAVDAKGDHAGAAAIARRALAANPRASPSLYARAAGYAVAAGDAATARGLLAYRLANLAGDGDGPLRDALVASYLAEGRVAEAIDAAGAQTFDDVALRADLAAQLGDLTAAADLRASDPEGALAAYLRWLDAYGEPDHPLLRATAEEIVRAAVTERRAALDRLAAEALAAGDPARAAVLVSEAHRVLAHDGARVALCARIAAAIAEPAAADPVAYGLALAGDLALRAGKVGDALRAYRRAVSHAPWWAHARRNLAVLLESTGQRDAAAWQATWVTALDRP